MMPSMAKFLRRWGLPFLGLLLPSCLLASPTFGPLNMPVGVTPLSREIYQLHMTMFYICCGIGVAVFGVLFYSLYKYRRSKGAVAQELHEHPLIEAAWTIIPFIILVIIAIPASRVLYLSKNSDNPQLTVKVVGYQWRWRYAYLDQGIDFFSNLSTPQDQIYGNAPKNPHFLLEVDHPLVVPIHEKIRFLITSNDVVHSWWVEALGIKQDAIPGYINDVWAYIEKPGTYRGQCTALCGAGHGFMPIVVKAVSQSEFNRWVRQQQQLANDHVKASHKQYSSAELIQLGHSAYDKNCAQCHQPNGQGVPPAFPAIAGSHVATGPMASHINLVLHGVSGTAMQAFGSQLDDLTIAAILTYQRNAWGNATRTQQAHHRLVIEPADVAKARQSVA